MGEENGARKYNGWANYETWAVKLWLDNEQSSYFYWTELAMQWHGVDEAACGFARRIEEGVVDAAPLAKASLYSDLLRAALAEVDWLEIAESYLDDVGAADDGQGSTEGGESCDGRAMPEPTPENRPDRREPTEPDPLESEGLFGDLLFAYTREQAVADGVLVDASQAAKEAGFKVPVALTRAVWAEFVEVPEGVEGQDESGRLWDVVWMCRFAIGRGKNRDASEFLFQLRVRNDDREGEPPLATLKAVCGPDDDANPCITIMRPEED